LSSTNGSGKGFAIHCGTAESLEKLNIDSTLSEIFVQLNDSEAQELWKLKFKFVLYGELNG
jgi:hypothetical protein